MVTVRDRGPFWDASMTEPGWRRQLRAWLAECAAVLEGRHAPACEGIPQDVRAACMARPAPQDMEKVVSMSASTRVSAPPGRAWQLLRDPATWLLATPDGVTAGHVPGAPVQRPGEMQYVIHRVPAGQLHVDLAVVDELDEGRTTLAPSIATGNIYAETCHRLEPDGEGTRLTLTWRVIHPAAMDLRTELEARIATEVSRCQSAIEARNAS